MWTFIVQCSYWLVVTLVRPAFLLLGQDICKCTKQIILWPNVFRESKNCCQKIKHRCQINNIFGPNSHIMLQTFWSQWTDCIWHSWIPQANQTIEFESKIVTMNKLNRRFEHSTTSRKKTIIDFKELKIGAAFPGGIHKGCIFLLQFLYREALARVSIHITLHIKCRNTKIKHILPDILVLCCLLFGDWLRIFEIHTVVIFVSVH